MSGKLALPMEEPVRQKGLGLGANMLLLAWRTPEFRLGLTVFLILILCSLIGPYFGVSPTKFDVPNRFLPPVPITGSSWSHLLGTDQLGRDLLVRSLIGLRNALLIGVASVVGMFVVGCVIGVLAGYW